MSRRQTAAQILTEALMAAQLVNFGHDGDFTAWYRASGGQQRKFYEALEKGMIRRIDPKWKESQHPDFIAAWEAIFGDPLRIPSYGHFRKMIRMARSRIFTDPANWDRLPDSFDAIYYLSFLANETLIELLNSGAVCKTTSLERVKELRADYQKLQQQIEEKTLQQNSVKKT
jgi:hypothetical protein